MDRSEEILGYWFGPLNDHYDLGSNQKMWWTKSDEADADMRQRFGEEHRRAALGELDVFQYSPRRCLALVLLLDQLSRNLHRGSGEAFANDAKAQRLVVGALDRGFEKGLRAAERVFLYMPLMHAEDLELQHRSLDRFAVLAGEAPEDRRKDFEVFHAFAVKHAIIVSRFGRYPHRNAALGRPTTPVEAAFLQQPGSSF
jgi:uncharacterized protein (DUF924 family)